MSGGELGFKSAASADNAASLVGTQAVIEGTVVLTDYASGSSGQPTFLDFHDPYQGHFIVVIWGVNRNKFDQAPEVKYLHHDVCVNGTVQSYKGRSRDHRGLA
jgi:hypothetical protein